MNEYFERIRVIASELSDMSPKTQMEIVKKCKEICLQVNEACENGVIATDEDIATLNDAIETITESLNTKASTQALNDAVASLTTALNDKASTQALNDAVASLEALISAVPVVSGSTLNAPNNDDLGKITIGNNTYNVQNLHIYHIKISTTTYTCEFNFFTRQRNITTRLQLWNAFIDYVPNNTGFMASGVFSGMGSYWNIEEIIKTTSQYDTVENVMCMLCYTNSLAPYYLNLRYTTFMDTSACQVTITKIY